MAGSVRSEIPFGFSQSGLVRIAPQGDTDGTELNDADTAHGDPARAIQKRLCWCYLFLGFGNQHVAICQYFNPAGMARNEGIDLKAGGGRQMARDLRLCRWYLQIPDARLFVMETAGAVPKTCILGSPNRRSATNSPRQSPPLAQKSPSPCPTS